MIHQPEIHYEDQEAVGHPEQSVAYDEPPIDMEVPFSSAEQNP